MSDSHIITVPEICQTCYKHAWNVCQIAEGDHCDICNKWFCNKHILIKSQRDSNTYYDNNGTLIDSSTIDFTKYLIDHENCCVLCYDCNK